MDTYAIAGYSMLQQRIKPGSLLVETDRSAADAGLVPTLKLTRNGITIQELPLDQSPILIGRAEDNDISIPTPYVSKHHIVLVRREHSAILIDLNSTNGTFVNSERVHKRVLEHNDVITVDRRSLFVTYQIEFCDPLTIADTLSEDDGTVDLEIEKIVAGFEDLLIGGDTDLLPELSEDVPTIVGVIDDR